MRIHGLAAVLVVASCSGVAPRPSSSCTTGKCDGPGPDASADPDTVVMTGNGAVTGVLEGTTYVFHGIPFAAPPVGPLRWRKPQPPAAWQGVQPARDWSAPCVQPTSQTSSGSTIGSEDCLYLNVWTPASRTNGSLPVMVYMHGGFNIFGAASMDRWGQKLFDMRALSERGPVIAVSFDYRVGTLGFLAHRALEEDGASGNYGLYDQVAALKWVRDNIARFGGDPNRVLLFGQSAGSIDTCVQVASPLARGLFSRAVQVSWPCPPGLDLATAENAGDQLAQQIGCTDGDVAACLRAADATQLATAFPPFGTPHVPSSPVVDGALLPDTPANVIAQQQHNAVPIIISTTSEEYGSLLVSIGVTGRVTWETYTSKVRSRYPNHALAILAHYPPSRFATANQALITVFTHARVTCPSRREARALAAAQLAPVRRYLFTHRFDDGPETRFGAAHGFDLPFIFHNLAFASFAPSAAEVALADEMSDAFIRFAATGDPTGDGLASWPLTGSDGNGAAVFDETVSTTNDVAAADCDFWDALGV
jgi:para-nitrobenzyl esterase